MGSTGFLRWLLLLSLFLVGCKHTTAFGDTRTTATQQYKNAYATMMYMGTPRDYEFYIATRVLLKSLNTLKVEADLVVIASIDVPLRWIRALEEEDGAKWSCSMLTTSSSKKTDELFQCGRFCAVFINPCIFHTGLFVLQPSMKVFKDMVHELEIGRENPDGADQGFISGYFPDLLDQPMFHPPPNGTKLDGTYRLPLGYQMDASYYYLRLRWSIPCGPNSVITFPGAPWLKPWYWWSWPVLPLGIQWHEQRRQTLGYAAEMPLAFIQSVIYLGIIAMARLARPNLSKLCYRRSDKSITILQNSLKLVALWCIFAAYILPVFIIPHTIHPLLGWTLYLLGAFAFSSIAINAFLLPMLPVLVPWLGIFGVLLVMAFPWYPDGVIRALTVFGYAFCSAPILWVSIAKIMTGLQLSLEREAFLPRLVESLPPSVFNKLY
ncbi:Nucleotide-diphospho-sugar transferases superfamily protein [Quillaja saponaria]|uniref:Nucleotide-diphospho-sugar transferases superfamily protein n=1 Tax=Quillaja saponaria TaxID=32244 RepID=A0AAD7L805_QUISA|nr:Nucleotide-diphospho-sugar transferases superfamily protein [Quillaja saponaria]